METNKYKLICFDMDGTLIRNTNSVEFLCMVADVYEESREIRRQEHAGEFNWIDSDFKKAKLLSGLEVETIGKAFDKYIEVISGLTELLIELRNYNYLCILITAGPKIVADEILKRYDFDACFGSQFEVVNERLTGNILYHMESEGKLNALTDYCREKAIRLEEVIAIGDSDSDIVVFEEAGLSIAINYRKVLEGKADYYFSTENIMDLADVLTTK